MAEFKYSLITKEGRIRSWKEPHGGSHVGRFLLRSPKIVEKGGHPWVQLKHRGRVGYYSPGGRWYVYDYRLLRTAFLTKQTGHQKIWREGDPTPIDFDKEEWKTNLEGTAFAVWDVTENDPPERLLRPRKIDWGLVIMAAVGALGMGLFIGNLIKK